LIFSGKILNKKSTVAQKYMVSFAKLLGIRQGIGEKYKNMGLEKFQLPILRIDTIFKDRRIPQNFMNFKLNNFKV
jgi:hypothetical protein